MNAGRIALALLSLVASAAPALAESGKPPQRATSIVVYGDDPCPKEEGDEIVVCARRPESERYRIPRKLREKEAEPLETSWVDRVRSVEEAQRSTRPNSCSVVGSGGQTGCFAEMLARWLAERQAAKSDGTP